MAQLGVGVAQPPGLAGAAEQGLHDREGDQFGIGQLGYESERRPPGDQVGVFLDQVIDRHVECRSEGVQI